MNALLKEENPIYLQISKMIELDILWGILPEEDRIPSMNELAKKYTINPATAAKGINTLVNMGILYKKRGIGMFVTSGAKEAIRKARKETFKDNYVISLAREAKEIGIDRKEIISMIESIQEDL